MTDGTANQGDHIVFTLSDIVNKTGDLVPRKLKCRGHYGYTSGFLENDFCEACPLVESCKVATQQKVPTLELRRLQALEQVKGHIDRTKNQARYTSFPTKNPFAKVSS